MTDFHSKPGITKPEHSLVPPRPARGHVQPEIKATPLEPQSMAGTSGHWIGFAGLIVAGVIGAFGLVYTNSVRIQYEDKAHQADLVRKDTELSLKANEGQKLSADKNVILRQYLADLIVSQTPDADLKLQALAQFGLPTPDGNLLLQDALAVRRLVEERRARLATATPTASEQKPTDPQPQVVNPAAASVEPSASLATDPMSMGRMFVQSNDFEQALASFTRATRVNPSDALAWNFKGYAMYRLHRLDEALQSLRQGLKLDPTDEKTRRFLVLNGTKVLCAQNRFVEASEFFNKSSGSVPSLVSEAQKDGQLHIVCKSIWRG